MLLSPFFFSYLYLNFMNDIAYCDNTIMSQFLEFTENVLDKASDLIKQSKFLQPGPIDCAQIKRNGKNTSGIYRIWPLTWQRFGSLSVFCDMATDDGGWTIIQKRGQFGNPPDYFYKDWNDYKLGFGDLNKEFWIGNDQLFAITNQGNYSLRIDMKDLEGEKRFALYKEFWIENEDHDYKIHVSSYSGNAGDSLSYVNGSKFTAKDKDNDKSRENCAVIFRCGWWYDDCHHSNLNGLNFNGLNKRYMRTGEIEWHMWKERYFLPEVEMKIRPINFK